MTAIATLHSALIARILGEQGQAPRALRRAAFENAAFGEEVPDEPIRSLVDKVAYRSYQVTDQDIAAARAAGLSQDEVFEVVVCAAVGQASRQYDCALAALADAIGDSE